MAGLVLAGCSEPGPPEVTFFSSGETVHTLPTLYCTDQCRQNPRARAQLRVPAGEPLQISVPAELADAPWVAVFRYRTANGKPGPESRTRIFQPGTQHAYTLRPPGGSDQLTEVQVHRVSGLQMGDDSGGEIQFVSDATWALGTT